jgi:hypothetical protein
VIPPRCDLCGRKAQLGGKRPFGGYSLVQFRDHVPEEPITISPGLAWFCSAHVGPARRLTNLPRMDALAELRSEYLAARTPPRRRWLRRRAG